jgi:hypothetical protein
MTRRPDEDLWNHQRPQKCDVTPSLNLNTQARQSSGASRAPNDFSSFSMWSCSDSSLTLYSRTTREHRGVHAVSSDAVGGEHTAVHVVRAALQAPPKDNSTPAGVEGATGKRTRHRRVWKAPKLNNILWPTVTAHFATLRVHRVFVG